MTAMMVFPGAIESGRMRQQRIRLRFAPDPAHRGRHMLIGRDGTRISQDRFRRLRRERGVWIETDTPATVCQALRLGRPDDEPGIHPVELA